MNESRVKGGRAAQAARSPERKSEIARMGAAARWAKARQQQAPGDPEGELGWYLVVALCTLVAALIYVIVP